METIINRHTVLSVSLLCLAFMPTHAGQLSGAIFTTDAGGTQVNGNIYADFCDVFLDGGPGPNAPAGAAGLPDGDYYFQVTDRSGRELLSTDPVINRQFNVAGGVIAGLSGAGNHRTGVDRDHGAVTVQLCPFLESPAPGSGYKVWVTPVASFEGDASIVDNGYRPGYFHGFVPAAAKTDNFKVRAHAVNTPPIADAGPDQTVPVGAEVHLDGSDSSDADGDLLTFSWQLVEVPAGSGAQLSDDTSIDPRFVADLPGEYVAELIVNDGFVDSAPDRVTISTTNTRPVANAGDDQSVALAALVELDGSGSFDADNDPLDYSWRLISAPAGSGAMLVNANTVSPTFVADQPGSYEIELVVSDGRADSDPDTVIVTTLNTAPVADAGADQDVRAGDTVTLDGRNSSDADGDPLTFTWDLIVRPAPSASTIDQFDAEVTSFTPDVAGDYVVQLIVNDGELDSAPDTAVITATVAATLAIDDVRVNETAQVATFTVTLDMPSDEAVSVSFQTADITATAGEDYVAAAGVIEFPQGVTTQTIEIQLLDDDTVEGEEMFAVLLSDPVNAELADAEGIATIVNDDLPLLAIDDVTQVEGSSPNFFVFTVTLIGASPVPVTVDFATMDGTARVQSEDYLATQGTLEFDGDDGETRTIEVLVFGDTTEEDDESFFVVLSNPVNALLADDDGEGESRGVGTIVDDDTMVGGASAGAAAGEIGSEGEAGQGAAALDRLALMTLLLIVAASSRGCRDRASRR